MDRASGRGLSQVQQVFATQCSQREALGSIKNSSTQGLPPSPPDLAGLRQIAPKPMDWPGAFHSGPDQHLGPGAASSPEQLWPWALVASSIECSWHKNHFLPRSVDREGAQ